METRVDTSQTVPRDVFAFTVLTVLSRTRFLARPRLRTITNKRRYLPCDDYRCSNHIRSSLRNLFSSRSSSGSEGVSSVDKEQWKALILEFERRSEEAERKVAESQKRQSIGDESAEFSEPTPPPGRPLGRWNPELAELAPVAESAMMTAASSVLWSCGRLLGLDSLLILFYPLPSLFIMMRWGPYYGNIVIVTSLVLTLTLIGPLFGVAYAFNTSAMTFAFGNTLWRQWHWTLTLAAGASAKSVGLFLQLGFTSLLMQENAFKFLGEQVKSIVDSFGGTFFRIFRLGVFAGPTLFHVQVAVAVLLLLHSFLYVFLTHLALTMILDRLYDVGMLKRPPRMFPLLSWLKVRVNKMYDDMYERSIYGVVRRSTDRDAGSR